MKMEVPDGKKRETEKENRSKKIDNWTEGQKEEESETEQEVNGATVKEKEGNRGTIGWRCKVKGKEGG